MEKILFCQFDTNLLYKDMKKDISTIYYNDIYVKRKKDGYYKTKAFWEVPLWVAEASFILKKYKQKLYIINDINNSIDYINNSKAEYTFFSVLDINKEDIYTIIKKCKDKKFIIGGYINFSEFKKLSNCEIVDSMKNLSLKFNLVYTYGVDYTLFKGLSVIPRLTLSNGCLNKCKFCTISNNITEYTKNEIIQQAKSFEGLKFKLVYINDKTYGQAKNYKLLKQAYIEIKKYNSRFKGFIIQTTAIKCNDINFIKQFKNLHIKVCEIGIETYNNDILKAMKKPQNEKTIKQSIYNLKKYNIKIIGNFIIGLLQETKKTYNNTLNFINKNIKNFYILNIYNLAVYSNTELDKEVKTNNINDNNEMIKEKSFYNKTDIKNLNYFSNKIFKMGLKILDNNAI